MRVRIELHKSVSVQLGLKLERQRPPTMNPVGQSPPAEELVSFLQSSSRSPRVQITGVGPVARKEAQQRELPRDTIPGQPVPACKHMSHA